MILEFTFSRSSRLPACGGRLTYHDDVGSALPQSLVPRTRASVRTGPPACRRDAHGPRRGLATPAVACPRPARMRHGRSCTAATVTFRFMNLSLPQKELLGQLQMASDDSHRFCGNPVSAPFTCCDHHLGVQRMQRHTRQRKTRARIRPERDAYTVESEMKIVVADDLPVSSLSCFKRGGMDGPRSDDRAPFALDLADAERDGPGRHL